MLRSEFWPTAAQVMPVLALAIVLEARTIIGRWSQDIPVWLRFIQGIFWVTPLALFAYLEPVAFLVMAGRANRNSEVLLPIYAIALAGGVLIFAPVIELLVRSNATVFFRIIGFIVSFGFNLTYLYDKHKARKVLRKVALGRSLQIENLAAIAAEELKIAMSGRKRLPL